MPGDSQGAAPHGGAEPLDQPRLPEDKAVSLHRRVGDRRQSGRRRCAAGFRQQFRGSVTEAALIEKEEVEPGEVRGDQGELLAQWRLRQAQRPDHGEPVGFDVEEHEGAVVAPAG